MKNECTTCDGLQAIIESQKETNLAILTKAHGTKMSLRWALEQLSINGYKPKTKVDEIALAKAYTHAGLVNVEKETQ
jgi:hypothetical protein